MPAASWSAAYTFIISMYGFMNELLCPVMHSRTNIFMAPHFNNDDERSNALKRVRISMLVISALSVILFLFMAYKTFIK